ncbi:GNAT family N-acetyltransferase [Flavobacteriaceae bacterium 3-367]|uniref:GNAT family N-acetyltransferase n=1 Tax=Eudoraea algarum TaxID=3417568 RepID=UPI0032737BF7
MEIEPFTLDPLQQEDAASLSLLMVSNAERFERFFPRTLAQNTSTSDSLTFIQTKKVEARTKKEFTFALRDSGNNTIAGLVIIKELNWTKKQGELAYCIGQRYEGRGWMTQAVGRLSRLAVSEWGLKTLQIIVHAENVASIAVAKKSGYRWQRTLHKAYTPPKERALDMELYELHV